MVNRITSRASFLGSQNVEVPKGGMDSAMLSSENLQNKLALCIIIEYSQEKSVQSYLISCQIISWVVFRN